MSSGARVALMVIGAIALVAVVAGVGLLLASGGSSSSATPPISVAPAVQRFPNPPAGAFVTARADGSHALALAIVQRPRGVALQVSDVTQNGAGASGLHVSFAVTSKSGNGRATATVCGPGCYHASVPLGSRPLAVRVRVERPAGTTSWTVALPASWPAKDAGAIVARATRTWKALRSVRFSERLSSDATHTVLSDWQIVAPDRLAYQIHNGGQAMIVGLHRWDRQKGGAWVKSSAQRLHQPQPFWVSATDAHVVDSTTLRGRPVWRVSFFDPRTPGWFLIAIDKGSYRTLDVRMTATAHFMHDSYRGFNSPITIVPPASG
jgi:hypothetical protein